MLQGYFLFKQINKYNHIPAWLQRAGRRSLLHAGTAHTGYGAGRSMECTYSCALHCPGTLEKHFQKNSTSEGEGWLCAVTNHFHHGSSYLSKHLIQTFLKDFYFYLLHNVSCDSPRQSCVACVHENNGIWLVPARSYLKHEESRLLYNWNNF